MSRSVDYLNNAEYVFYFPYETDEDGQEDWEFLVECIQEHIQKRLPSYSECDAWDGRETRIILENSFCEIGISEYCGLVSVSIRTKENLHYCPDLSGLAGNHIMQIRESLEKALVQSGAVLLTKLGTFSNGEAVFEKKVG